MESLASSSWTWGWEAFVAIGTVLLAVATFALAWLTRRLAQSGLEDVRSQYRPVLLPATDSATTRAVVLNRAEGSLRVRIRNVGRGPALFVRSQLDPFNASAANWSLAALAPGDEQDLIFRAVVDRQLIQLLLDYRDLAGRAHSSSITLTVYDTDATSYDLYLFKDHSVTTHGGAIYPQSGLRDVRPRPVGLMDRVLRRRGGRST